MTNRRNFAIGAQRTNRGGIAAPPAEQDGAIPLPPARPLPRPPVDRVEPLQRPRIDVAPILHALPHQITLIPWGPRPDADALITQLGVEWLRPETIETCKVDVASQLFFPEAPEDVVRLMTVLESARRSEKKRLRLKGTHADLKEVAQHLNRLIGPAANDQQLALALRQIAEHKKSPVLFELARTVAAGPGAGSRRPGSRCYRARFRSNNEDLARGIVRSLMRDPEPAEAIRILTLVHGIERIHTALRIPVDIERGQSIRGLDLINLTGYETVRGLGYHPIVQERGFRQLLSDMRQTLAMGTYLQLAGPQTYLAAAAQMVTDRTLPAEAFLQRFLNDPRIAPPTLQPLYEAWLRDGLLNAEQAQRCGIGGRYPELDRYAFGYRLRPNIPRTVFVPTGHQRLATSISEELHWWKPGSGSSAARIEEFCRALARTYAASDIIEALSIVGSQEINWGNFIYYRTRPLWIEPESDTPYHALESIHATLDRHGQQLEVHGLIALAMYAAHLRPLLPYEHQASFLPELGHQLTTAIHRAQQRDFGFDAGAIRQDEPVPVHMATTVTTVVPQRPQAQDTPHPAAQNPVEATVPSLDPETAVLTHDDFDVAKEFLGFFPSQTVPFLERWFLHAPQALTEAQMRERGDLLLQALSNHQISPQAYRVLRPEITDQDLAAAVPNWFQAAAVIGAWQGQMLQEEQEAHIARWLDQGEIDLKDIPRPFLDQASLKFSRQLVARGAPYALLEPYINELTADELFIWITDERHEIALQYADLTPENRAKLRAEQLQDLADRALITPAELFEARPELRTWENGIELLRNQRITALEFRECFRDTHLDEAAVRNALEQGLLPAPMIMDTWGGHMGRDALFALAKDGLVEAAEYAPRFSQAQAIELVQEERLPFLVFARHFPDAKEAARTLIGQAYITQAEFFLGYHDATEERIAWRMATRTRAITINDFAAAFPASPRILAWVREQAQDSQEAFFRHAAGLPAAARRVIGQDRVDAMATQVDYCHYLRTFGAPSEEQLQAWYADARTPQQRQALQQALFDGWQTDAPLPALWLDVLASKLPNRDALDTSRRFPAALTALRLNLGPAGEKRRAFVHRLLLACLQGPDAYRPAPAQPLNEQDPEATFECLVCFDDKPVAERRLDHGSQACAAANVCRTCQAEQLNQDVVPRQCTLQSDDGQRCGQTTTPNQLLALGLPVAQVDGFVRQVLAHELQGLEGWQNCRDVNCLTGLPVPNGQRANFHCHACGTQQEMDGIRINRERLRSIVQRLPNHRAAIIQKLGFRVDTDQALDDLVFHVEALYRGLNDKRQGEDHDAHGHHREGPMRQLVCGHLARKVEACAWMKCQCGCETNWNDGPSAGRHPFEGAVKRYIGPDDLLWALGFFDIPGGNLQPGDHSNRHLGPTLPAKLHALRGQFADRVPTLADIAERRGREMGLFGG